MMPGWERRRERAPLGRDRSRRDATERSRPRAHHRRRADRPPPLARRKGPTFHETWMSKDRVTRGTVLEDQLDYHPLAQWKKSLDEDRYGPLIFTVDFFAI
jgi:hypothetical protein